MTPLQRCCDLWLLMTITWSSADAREGACLVIHQVYGLLVKHVLFHRRQPSIFILQCTLPCLAMFTVMLGQRSPSSSDYPSLALNTLSRYAWIEARWGGARWIEGVVHLLRKGMPVTLKLTMGPVSVSHGETPRDWSWLGTAHTNGILEF